MKYVLALACVVGIVLFSVLAWSLWRGRGLEFISGNQFADKRELNLPYQRRMAKEVAILLLACDLALAALAACFLFSASTQTMLLVIAALGSVVVVGGLAISMRADNAAKTEQAEASMRERGWPVKDVGPGGGPSAKQWIAVVVLYLMMIPFAYFMVRLTSG